MAMSPVELGTRAYGSSVAGRQMSLSSVIKQVAAGWPSYHQKIRVEKADPIYKLVTVDFPTRYSRGSSTKTAPSFSHSILRLTQAAQASVSRSSGPERCSRIFPERYYPASGLTGICVCDVEMYTPPRCRVGLGFRSNHPLLSLRSGQRPFVVGARITSTTWRGICPCLRPDCIKLWISGSLRSPSLEPRRSA